MIGLRSWIKYWKPAQLNKPRLNKPNNPQTTVEGVVGEAGAIIVDEEIAAGAEAGVIHLDPSIKWKSKRRWIPLVIQHPLTRARRKTSYPER